MKALILLLISVISLSACRAITPEADLPKLGDTKWVLVAIKQNRTNLNDNAFIVFNEKESKITGKAACNSFYGEYAVLLKTNITFEGMGTTKMFCEGLMDEEEQIITSLQKIKRFEIKSDMLYLHSSDELLLTFKR